MSAELSGDYDFEFVMIGRIDNNFVHQIELEKKQGKLTEAFRVLDFVKI